MERLTKVDGIGKNEIIKCFDCDLERAGGDLEHCGYCEHWQAVLDRLAAYEDTGLEPEDIKAAFTEEAMLKLAAQFLGTTPENLRELVKAWDELDAEGLECVEIKQHSSVLHPATKLLREAVLRRKFRYDENRLLEINFQNARCTEDTNMNKYVNKKRSAGKVDMVVALINAVHLVQAELLYGALDWVAQT